MKHKLLILTAALASQVHAEDNQIQGAPFLTVGNGGTCDYSSIQAAIDSTLSNVIRIASDKVYNENITIDDRNMVLTGGYADCSGANNNITDLSSAVIDGGGSGAVVSVSGNSEERSVDIRNLLIGNGTSGLMSTADVQLNVENVTLINNDNVGAFIFGGDNNVSFVDVVVSSNDGSGIICAGQENILNIQGESLISDNDTSNSGGGLLITGGCKANLFAPVKVKDNSSVGDGGGIKVADGSIVNLNGIEILGNEAGSDGNGSGSGGGVSVSGEFSIVNAVNSKFRDNKGHTGGAVEAFDQGQFTSYAANTLANPCHTPGSCTDYRGNTAGNLGGVFAATQNGKITVLHANIKHNGLLGDNGLIGFASLDGVLKIEGSMIVKNGTDSFPGINLFYINGGVNQASAISLNHVTIASNEITESVVHNSGGIFAMNSSIVQESVDVSKTTNAASHDFECVIAHETSSFSAGGTVTIDDPEFINPLTNDFHIKPTSPAIDYCYAAEPLTVELGYDMDFEGRNYDDPNVTNLHGTYDIGADEYRWDNDLIFMNGFEQN
ncbi:hypothetical protein [Marinicella rhabdoformis]|uniref:hypothetical protein n=1 Tax=Marinicella rhabdoformis TaxID=2580566 RepID=UPI0012AED9AD|nr:hypothetical protein [Marinicella rhabdoformis]